MKASELDGGERTVRLGRNYDAIYKDEAKGIPLLDLNRWPRNRWEALARCCPRKTRNVLDIGCGNGVVLYYISDKCENLTGLEISKNRCEVARMNLENVKRRVEIVCGSIEEGMDKPDGFFDAILWADVIEHVVDVFRAMKEIGRFPSTGSKDEGFAVRSGEMYDAGHMHYFTFRTLERLYVMNGILPTRRLGFGRLGRLHNLWPSMLSGAALLVGKKRPETECYS